MERWELEHRIEVLVALRLYGPLTAEEERELAELYDLERRARAANPPVAS